MIAHRLATEVHECGRLQQQDGTAFQPPLQEISVADRRERPAAGIRNVVKKSETDVVSGVHIFGPRVPQAYDKKAVHFGPLGL